VASRCLFGGLASKQAVPSTYRHPLSSIRPLQVRAGLGKTHASRRVMNYVRY
jgi:hypothetical protein